MSRLGVRRSAGVLAMVAVGIAFALGAALLLITLEGSLIDEIDRSHQSRADDILGQWDSSNDFIVLGAGFDTLTFAAVADGEGFYDTTDSSVDPSTMRAAIPALGVPTTIDFELESTESTKLRMLAVLTSDPDVVVEEDVVLDFDEPVVFVGSSLEPVDSTVREVLFGAVVLGPLFVLLVGALTWYLTGRSLRPVEAIRREVETISSTGLDRRVPEPDVDDEIGMLAGTMNTMLSRLEQSQAAQQQFVSDASHELRSPLASMAAILDVAERHGTNDEWPETATALQRETQRMRRLVDDLLLLARADARGDEQAVLDRPRTLVDLDDVVLDVVRTTSVPDEISLDASAVSAGLVTGDGDQLRRVIINLIENATRHARSRVDLAVVEVDGVVEFTVDDDGPGIPEADRRRVFERFVRLDDDRGRRTGGTGLGLAISAEIAARHAGSIDVETSGLGGSRFTLRVPAHHSPHDS